jgi:hypothetical protein
LKSEIEKKNLSQLGLNCYACNLRHEIVTTPYKGKWIKTQRPIPNQSNIEGWN